MEERYQEKNMAVKPPVTTWHFASLTQHFKATPEPLSAGKLGKPAER